MENFLTIIYANRNKDLSRIKASLVSLDRQTNKDFKVIFVDYGSDKEKVPLLENLLLEFYFVEFVPLAVPQLLWNKSKALNYGIKHSKSQFVFIADVDLLFHPSSTQLFAKLASSNEYHLFKMAYLDEMESFKLASSFDFEKVKVRNYGYVNGMVLASKKAFERVNGYDEFFHFYGAEDEDLYARMKNLGLKANDSPYSYFYHNWHPTYPSSENENLSKNPRVQNIRRINQYHHLENKRNGTIKPNRQEEWGNPVSEKDLKKLQFPTKIYRVPNILSFVEHFLNEDLVCLKNEIVKVEFFEDPYFLSLKHTVKKFLRKQTQPYCTLKEVNDRLLKKILFEYRDFPYSFEVANDLKSINFVIKL
jgi:glycosyltransferase involved in cell wall biosynthesis